MDRVQSGWARQRLSVLLQSPRSEQLQPVLRDRESCGFQELLRLAICDRGFRERKHSTETAAEKAPFSGFSNDELIHRAAERLQNLSRRASLQRSSRVGGEYKRPTKARRRAFRTGMSRLSGFQILFALVPLCPRQAVFPK